MVLYVGIADAYGLDAFAKEGDAPIGMLALRAQQNRHRHSMVFRINVSKEDGEMLEKLFRKDYKKALLKIKELERQGKCDVALHQAGPPEQAEKRWNKIPNEDLVW